MNTEYEIIEGLKAGYEEAYKYIYDRQYKILCIIAKEYVDDNFHRRDDCKRCHFCPMEKPERNRHQPFVTQLSD